MGKYTLDLEQYRRTARQAAAEGCVLLKNDDAALPLRSGDRVSVFGRIAFHYYKSGLGSGGLVNAPYVTGIPDALREEKEITLNEKLMEIYEEWIRENPFDEGAGWGRVPWSQKEMPLTEDVVKEAAACSDIALVLIGRTAGEDQDSRDTQGSFRLTDAETDMIRKVSAAFPRTAVLLNVGNIIDMQWVKEIRPQAVMYVWQGGQEGGHAAADVLTGRVDPCGRLTATIAEHIEDHPSAAGFGDPVRNYYKEDIFVGYRYFETFAKEKVLYPFGFGLSYTTFSMDAKLAELPQECRAGENGEAAESCLAEEAGRNQGNSPAPESCLTVEVCVHNTGSVPGKEVVQVYACAPQGRLGKPLRVLAGFVKTDVIPAGETWKGSVRIPLYRLASYDDSGVTGYKSCYVLEAGEYKLYTGCNVREAEYTGSWHSEFTVLEKLSENMAPVRGFERLRAVISDAPVAAAAVSDAPVAAAVGGDASGITEGYEPVPLRTVDMTSRQIVERTREKAYVGDRGYLLEDVALGRCSCDDFLTQLTDEDLIHLFRGEGMCSPKVTPGTAAAFGGVTERLQSFGIPAACCSDGPSGIRMDCGTMAYSLPNGTCLGCSFNEEINEALYTLTGLELRKNRIDALLGPGMNIQRNPLNGRNFEYFSEDPLLTGKIAAAQVRGMNRSGTTGTIKHFCGNNQEFKRHEADSVISERALREIYLKGFEIAVKEAPAKAVMTSYGPVNGTWTAGNYDLVTRILRKEWGFTGIVMTDWWAAANRECGESSSYIHAPMICAQNDIFMVTKDASDMGQDDALEMLAAGEITRSDLVRNAKNILKFILESPAMLYQMNRISQEELDERNKEEDDVAPSDVQFCAFEDGSSHVSIMPETLHPAKGKRDVYAVTFEQPGKYELVLKMRSRLDALAQLPLSVLIDSHLVQMVSIQGTGGREVTETVPIHIMGGDVHYLGLYYGADGMEITGAELYLRETGVRYTI